MSTRIEKRFAALKDEGRAALVTFTMAGDPDYDTSLAIAKALPKAGADIIELGMPFTDPMADGPAIQAAGLRALKSGQRMTKTLPKVLTNTSGFVYYVSITGITGAAAPDTTRVATAVTRIKRHTGLPVAVGFGVRTAEQARAIAEGADGVVVGSALVDALRNSLDKSGKASPGSVKAVTDLVSSLAQGMRSAPRVAAT